MMKHLFLGLSAVLLSTSLVTAQEVSVPLVRPDGTVRFFVSVTSQAGQPVSDLHQEDFTVYDGNVIRPIRLFRSSSASKGLHGKYVYMTIARENSADTHSAADSSPNYEIIFDGAQSIQRQFHEVGIKVHRPNVEITTSFGYFTAAN